jgi:hypothetical protein
MPPAFNLSQDQTLQFNLFLATYFSSLSIHQVLSGLTQQAPSGRLTGGGKPQALNKI